MSTECKCNNRPGIWKSVEQEWAIKNAEMMKSIHREEMVKEIVKLMEAHHQVWFSQSLNIGSGAFWANKASTTKQLINEIRGLK